MNQLLKKLKAKLQKVQRTKQDQYNNVVYIDSNIFCVETLVDILNTALTTYNSLPIFTFHTIENLSEIGQDKIVNIAFAMSMACQSLIETGKEFKLSENGIGFIIPSTSEMLNTSWGAGLEYLIEEYKKEKNYEEE